MKKALDGMLKWLECNPEAIIGSGLLLIVVALATGAILHPEVLQCGSNDSAAWFMIGFMIGGK